MSAVLVRAYAAGMALTLQPDGRITWKAPRPIAPDMLADLRARREEIRAALVAASWPTHLLADPAEVVLRGELAMIEGAPSERTADSATAVHVREQNPQARTDIGFAVTGSAAHFSSGEQMVSKIHRLGTRR